MAEVSTERLAAFLSINDGSGDGSGYGYGDGSGSGSGYGYGYGFGSGDGSGDGDGSGYGYGYGFGDGDGFGSGDGDGSGYGYGYGFGSGIKTYCGLSVSIVDGIPCVIRRIKGSVAKAEIINSDLTTMPCYIVKQDSLFAHGKTLRDAMAALREKLFEDAPMEERIANFVREHHPGTIYPDADYYSWHHILTGSCDFGRKQFAEARGLEKLDGSRTPEEFIRMTVNEYGGDIIKKLIPYYPEVQDGKT